MRIFLFWTMFSAALTAGVIDTGVIRTSLPPGTGFLAALGAAALLMLRQRSARP